MSRENFNDCISKKKIVLVECVNHGLAFLKDKARVSNEIKNFCTINKCENRLTV